MAEFLCDYKEDVKDLPTSCGPGSWAKVVEDGSKYILNNQKRWILQPASSGGGGGGGSEDDPTELYESDIINLDNPNVPDVSEDEVLLIRQPSTSDDIITL